MFIDLSAYVNAIIVEYVPVDSIKELKRTNRSSKCLLDGKENQHIWKCLVADMKSNSLLKFGTKSATVNALLTKGSRKHLNCFVCNSTLFPVEYHSFYNIILCRNCINSPRFRTGGFKKTCKMFFIDPTSDLVKDIPKVRVGNYNKVLNSNMESIAVKKYGRDTLDYMINTRRVKRLRTMRNKIFKKDDRFDKLVELYENLLPTNIHPMLTSLNDVTDIMDDFNVSHVAYGDMLQCKVKVRTTPEIVCARIIDFSKMINSMIQYSILDENLQVQNPYTDIVYPGLVFQYHVFGGKNFYEQIMDVVISTSRFVQKSINFEYFSTHVCNNLDRDTRLQLAINFCTEDGIDYDQDSFEGFVENGIGNPVSIARKRRIIIFLNNYGYSSIVSDCVQSGVDINIAEKIAYKNSVHRSRGIPSMNYGCSIYVAGMPPLSHVNMNF